jgi:hypothetical protein
MTARLVGAQQTCPASGISFKGDLGLSVLGNKTLGDEMALTELSADEHAASMADYVAERNLAASALGSRGPVRYDADGNLHSDIIVNHSHSHVTHTTHHTPYITYTI